MNKLLNIIFTTFAIVIISACCKKPIFINTRTVDTIRFKPDTLYFSDTIKLKGDTVKLIFNPCDTLQKNIVKKGNKTTLVVVTDKKGNTTIECIADSLTLVIDSLNKVITTKEQIIENNTTEKIINLPYVPFWARFLIGVLGITTTYFVFKSVFK
jgi:hypothetical protein